MTESQEDKNVIESLFTNMRQKLNNLNIKEAFSSSIASVCSDKLLDQILSENIPLNIDSGFTSENLQNYLYISAFWGFHDFAKTLLSFNPDINFRNRSTGFTCLHAACFNEHQQVVELLLSNGADVNIEDFSGRSCLDFASTSKKLWPLFEALKFKRTSDEELVKKGILKTSFDNNSENMNKKETMEPITIKSETDKNSFHSSNFKRRSKETVSSLLHWS